LFFEGEAGGGPQRAPADKRNEGDLSHGLAKLVLTIIETLRQLMEQQARRRMNEGSLSDEEVERLGLAFMKLDEKVSEIASKFNLSKKDLQLTMATDEGPGDGPLFSLVDLLDRVIEKGLVVFGDLGISVADVELINLQLRLIVSSTRNRSAIKGGSISTKALRIDDSLQSIPARKMKRIRKLKKKKQKKQEKHKGIIKKTKREGLP